MAKGMVSTCGNAADGALGLGASDCTGDGAIDGPQEDTGEGARDEIKDSAGDCAADCARDDAGDGTAEGTWDDVTDDAFDADRDIVHDEGAGVKCPGKFEARADDDTVKENPVSCFWPFNARTCSGRRCVRSNFAEISGP